MSKKQNKLDSLLGLVKKGQKLYNEYGETVVSLANSLKRRNQANIVESSEVLVDEIQEETAIAKVEEAAVPSVQKPTDIKGYRAEVEADDSFHETLSTLEDAASIAFDGRITNPQEVCKALETLASVAVDTIKYSEEQETKREEIRARRDVAIAQVSAMRDAVQTYLEKSFDERSILFAKQFECVDAALKAGDNDMLAISLNNINALAASSPFKALADINQVQKALTSSETEWDI
jgi:hypothetical protein